MFETMKNKPLHPDTIIQPNRVTEMRYATKGIEENVFTLTLDALQDELYVGQMMDRNNWGELVLNLKSDEIAPTLKPNQVFDRLSELTKRNFEYSYISKKTGKEVRVYGVIFPSVYQSGTYIQVKVNTDALPFLVWLGETEDAGQKTYISKLAATYLHGTHTKRIYKFLSGWKSKKGWNTTIKEVKRRLDLIGQYEGKDGLKNFKKKVLDKAKKEMLENKKSDIWFEYRTYASGLEGRKHDRIIFTIHTRYSPKKMGKKQAPKQGDFETYNEIYKFLQYCLGATHYKAQQIADAIAEEGDKFMKRRYNDQKKLRDEERPKAFNFFMKAAEKDRKKNLVNAIQDNQAEHIFSLRFKDCINNQS